MLTRKYALEQPSNGLNSFSELEKVANPNSTLKRGIWIYFFLLIFEGALRKWVFPGLATYLLIVRDPIAIWILFTAWKRNLFSPRIFVFGTMVIGIIGIFTAIPFGHGSFPVALYGARILLIHFPLIFVIGNIFDRDDVVRAGKIILLLTPFMAVLIALQFYSPQSAWVNRGIGGEEGTGFSGAMGFFRPPATFSFTNGTGLFFGLSVCYILYFWIGKEKINRFVLILATIGLLAAIPLSISRSLSFIVIIAILFLLIAILHNPKHFSKLLVVGAAAAVAFVFLSQTQFFQTAIEAFTYRFETANEMEGGFKGVVGDRYFGGMLGALTQSETIPFFGYGLGMGTNAGSMLLTGERKFLFAEGEWGRMIGELGFLLGSLAIFLRLSFCFQISIASFKRLKLDDALPWMLLCFALISIPQGQWAQPTSLGFSVIVGGLTLASLNDPYQEENG